jgi:ferrochelatase
MKTAILMMAYGGPDSLADIEPYLLDIRGGRPTSPELVAEIRERYAKIGGRSPLLEITRAQASALETALNQQAPSADGSGGFRVYVGMRHWKPYIRDVVAQIAADGIHSGLAFCMAPHASKMSSGAYQQKLEAGLALLQQPLALDFIESWYDQPFLIEALAQKVRDELLQFSLQELPQVHYLFTAHSLPASLRDQGDPYADQLQLTTHLLVEELGLHPAQWSFAYQSAGAAPGQWLGPAIEEVLPALAAKGVQHVLVTPVGFTADHVEILFDLDIEAQAIAREVGLHLVRSQSLNASPDFIQGLAQFILEKAAIRHEQS